MKTSTFPTFFKPLSLLLFAVFAFSGCVTDEQPDGEEALDVPFTSQAPSKTWVEPWLNACEETSIVMVNLYYSDQEDPNIETAKQEILDVLAVKKEEIDMSKDESMETVLELIDLLDLNWSAEVVSNPTLEQMKTELESGRPIIVPVFAPELVNAYYEGGGPDYHVMVLVGYDDESGTFTIHDPGTQFGEELSFTYENLMAAIHDLKPSDYDSGAKKVLFTVPKAL